MSQKTRLASMALFACSCLRFEGTALASQQEPVHHHHESSGDSEEADLASTRLMNLASGTSLNPSSWKMPMGMTAVGRWRLLWMGQLFVDYTHQSGPRGGEKWFAPNTAMFGAMREVGRGSLLLRAMASLEPATISNREYPLLFQTGESVFGEPLVDGQHPHDLFMELGVHYARPLGSKGLLSLYYAPVGDPALGPVAFPHRASAMEIPQAPLGHHWQDSTHIATNVVTVGLDYRKVRFELSGLHGAEPDEERWNLNTGRIDSWAGRVTVQPTSKWSAQVSAGRLETPEPFHGDDVVRATASAHCTAGRGSRDWSSSFVWSRNYKTVEKAATSAILVETLFPWNDENLFTARFEWSERDELFPSQEHEDAHREVSLPQVFDVTSLTLGYTRDFMLVDGLRTGIGFNVTLHATPDALDPFYGASPYGVNVFFRLGIRGTKGAMGGMSMER
jgi:hypothetical protein